MPIFKHKVLLLSLLLPVSLLAGNNVTSENCLAYLYSKMSAADSTDRSVEYYLDNAIYPALDARNNLPWGKSIPDSLFYEYVLPVRINNEALDTHRPVIYSMLMDRIKELSMTDAILEVNRWCHEYVSYQPSDSRTHSPLQSMNSGIGRCGEESTFTVAALRAVGIPARQVYTPRWAHTDDNHAWVEAWADGKWYFLGACEPEPILNLGWFNEPASRGMYMHARTFDKNPRTVNVTANYAPTDSLTVTITDSEGCPVKNAVVTFRLYNYAELYPIITTHSDSDGNASIICGLGDLIVWASDKDKFGFKKISVGETRQDTISLTYNPTSYFSADLDLIPPKPSNSLPVVSDSLRNANNIRLAHEDSIRNSHISRHLTVPPSSLNITDSALYARASRIYTLARGNHDEITTFLHQIPREKISQAITLLENISEKDVSDIHSSILMDHWKSPVYDTPLFAAYIQSPRIADEELTPYRSYFNSVIDSTTSTAYRSNPLTWVKWVKDSIMTDISWYPEQITMSPASVWKHRHTSPLSRDIFFVAGARSFGIPSRLNPVTMTPQWADSDCQWHDVMFETTSEESNSSPKSRLQLFYKPGNDKRQPKYYSHYTLSAITDGQPELLSYPDFITCGELFATPQMLTPGQYLLTTGTRLADGSVLTSVKSIILPADSSVITTDSFSLRDDLSAIKVIGTFNSENLYLPEGTIKPQSILSSTGRGYYAMIITRDNHEPSNHAIRDISNASDALRAAGRPILILSDNHSLPTPDFIIKGSDYDSRITDEIINSLEIETPQYPIVVIADTFNRIVFFSQGYAIGIGVQIANILHRLDNQ
ncbi:MAG: transglutaminase domain-containing protein [Paramuribaculum sp.]|nr:transglutaminase domain-containing protein [Paramuribaculum sp.]